MSSNQKQEFHNLLRGSNKKRKGNEVPLVTVFTKMNKLSGPLVNTENGNELSSVSTLLNTFKKRYEKLMFDEMTYDENITKSNDFINYSLMDARQRLYGNQILNADSSQYSFDNEIRSRVDKAHKLLQRTQEQSSPTSKNEYAQHIVALPLKQSNGTLQVNNFMEENQSNLSNAQNNLQLPNQTQVNTTNDQLQQPMIGNQSYGSAQNNQDCSEQNQNQESYSEREQNQREEQRRPNNKNPRIIYQHSKKKKKGIKKEKRSEKKASKKRLKQKSTSPSKRNKTKKASQNNQTKKASQNNAQQHTTIQEESFNPSPKINLDQELAKLQEDYQNQLHSQYLMFLDNRKKLLERAHETNNITDDYLQDQLRQQQALHEAEIQKIVQRHQQQLDRKETSEDMINQEGNNRVRFEESYEVPDHINAARNYLGENRPESRLGHRFQHGSRQPVHRNNFMVAPGGIPSSDNKVPIRVSDSAFESHIQQNNQYIEEEGEQQEQKSQHEINQATRQQPRPPTRKQAPRVALDLEAPIPTKVTSSSNYTQHYENLASSHQENIVNSYRNKDNESSSTSPPPLTQEMSQQERNIRSNTNGSNTNLAFYPESKILRHANNLSTETSDTDIEEIIHQRPKTASTTTKKTKKTKKSKKVSRPTSAHPQSRLEQFQSSPVHAHFKNELATKTKKKKRSLSRAKSTSKRQSSKTASRKLSGPPKKLVKKRKLSLSEYSNENSTTVSSSSTDLDVHAQTILQHASTDQLEDLISKADSAYTRLQQSIAAYDAMDVSASSVDSPSAKRRRQKKHRKKGSKKKFYVLDDPIRQPLKTQQALEKRMDRIKSLYAMLKDVEAVSTTSSSTRGSL